jgi:hypothetical protein
MIHGCLITPEKQGNSGKTGLSFRLRKHHQVRFGNLRIGHEDNIINHSTVLGKRSQRMVSTRINFDKI